MNLDTKDWKVFRIDEIFVLKSGFYNKKPEHSEVGTFPFLGSIESNNGVSEFYSLNDIRGWDKVGNPDNTLKGKVYRGNCIAVTVNGSVGFAFYQIEDFTCSHDVTALYRKDGKEFTPSTALFMCTILMKERYRWSYGRKPHDNIRFGRSTIKLPVNCNGVPDWNFMETFIKSLHYKNISTNIESGFSPEIKVSDWKCFTLSRLFDIKKGKRLTAEEQTEGVYNYIGAIDSNNGVANHIGQLPIHSGTTISLSYNGSVGEAFYQDDDYWATDDVNALYPKFDGFNRSIGLFIVTILRQEKFKFSYGRKWTLDNMKKTVIKLPILRSNDGAPIIDGCKTYSDDGYIPDFKFMEIYMKSLPYGDRL